MKRIIQYSALFIFLVILTGQAKAESETTFYMVGNAHIDLAYRWRWNETVDRVTPDTFEGVLRMMQQEPDLTYAQSQLALYEVIQSNRPDIFTGIKEKIKSGNWSVVGGQWAEPDAILPSGESLIRQFLIGREYAGKHLGVRDIDIAWVPDSFCGQALTLPQIYSGCGMKYYVFGRGAPKDKRIFWWQSPDGSRILAYKMPHHYNLKVNKDLKKIADEWSAVSKCQHVMMFYGEGDHGGGPREPDVTGFKKLSALNEFPEMVYSTPENYFKILDSLNIDWPVYEGEMGIGKGESGNVNGSWRGSYTSQARTKKANRDMENLFLTAEKFAAIGSMLQRKPLFPRVDFRESWKIILRNQFHDILPGTSIGDVYDDAMNDYLYVKGEGERLLKFGLEVIGSRIDTRDHENPIVVYNPLSWTRTDIVRASVTFIIVPEKFYIKDNKGKNVLYQIDGWSEDGLTAYISFLAKDIPPIGYKVYQVIEGRPRFMDSDIKWGPDFVVNKYFKIKWDETGVRSIYDIRQRKEILAGTANTLRLLGEKRSSSWDLMLSGEEFPIESESSNPEVIDKGPARVSLLWQDHSEGAFITRELILKAQVPRIEFNMTVDWHEHDKILKAVFPANVDSGSAVFEQPYGYIQRENDGTEWPAQNWVDLSNDLSGVALLNDGKYGFDVNENVISMSVVRGARDMDPRMDEGTHSFGYALYPHEKDWRTGNVTRQALELNRPLIAMQENKHSGMLPKWGSLNPVEKSLSDEYSFFSVNSDHVIISAIKVQQGNWSPANIVLRLYETDGRDDTITVKLPAQPRKIIETNHIEEPLPEQSQINIKDRAFTVQIGHNQIRTFLIEF